jgi:hypothetical protein
LVTKLGAVGEGDDGDDGRDPDDYAEERKDGAELVSPERLEREFEGFDELHKSQWSVLSHQLLSWFAYLHRLQEAVDHLSHLV